MRVVGTFDLEILGSLAHRRHHQRARAAVTSAVFNGDDALVAYRVVDHLGIRWQDAHVIERDAR